MFLTCLLWYGGRSRLAPKTLAGKRDGGMGVKSVFSEMLSNAEDRKLLAKPKYFSYRLINIKFKRRRKPRHYRVTKTQAKGSLGSVLSV